MAGDTKSRYSSRRRSSRREVSAAEPREPGQQAQAPGLTLRSFQVGALPLVNRILERMRKGQARQSRGLFVDLGIILHRARAERVKARVHRIVELRKS